MNRIQNPVVGIRIPALLCFRTIVKPDSYLLKLNFDIFGHHVITTAESLMGANNKLAVGLSPKLIVILGSSNNIVKNFHFPILPQKLTFPFTSNLKTFFFYVFEHTLPIVENSELTVTKL